MAGIKISGCLTGIAGAHIKSFNSNGVVAVKDKEVRKDDISRAIDAAKAVAIPADRELLHVIPQEYIVDDQDGIKDPVGMSGVRLEVKVHIVTGSITSAQNIVKCCYLAGLSIDDLILGQLASAEATLTPEETEIGVALVDIGGGTSDIAVYANGAIRYTSVLPLGGNHITNDIAIGLRTPLEEAEKIKKKYGCAMSNMVGANETIEVPERGRKKAQDPDATRPLPISSSRGSRRSSPLFTKRSRSRDTRSCWHRALCSPAAAPTWKVCRSLPSAVFSLPVRRGYPIGVGGLVDVVNNPIYATGVGLILHGYSGKQEDAKGGYERRETFRRLLDQTMVKKVKELFKEIF